jgi:hypothetical protein
LVKKYWTAPTLLLGSISASVFSALTRRNQSARQTLSLWSVHDFPSQIGRASASIRFSASIAEAFRASSNEATSRFRKRNCQRNRLAAQFGELILSGEKCGVIASGHLAPKHLGVDALGPTERRVEALLAALDVVICRNRFLCAVLLDSLTACWRSSSLETA